MRSFVDLLAAMGLRGPDEIHPGLIFRRVGDTGVRSFHEIYRLLETGELLSDGPSSEERTRARTTA